VREKESIGIHTSQLIGYVIGAAHRSKDRYVISESDRSIGPYIT